jgi:hypothetical protein
MIALLLLAWVLVYHGFVLWLALRFKNKPWRWYWFATVLVVGWGVAWVDAIYTRLVVIDGYCASQDNIGGFDYQPAIAVSRDVTWLDSVEAKKTTPYASDSSPWLFNPKILYCIDEKDGRRGNCTVDEFRYEHHATKLIFGAWQSRQQLWKGQTLMRERVGFQWNEQWFFRVIGFNRHGMALGMLYDGKFECSGPDRGIFSDWQRYAADVIARIEVK